VAVVEEVVGRAGDADCVGGLPVDRGPGGDISIRNTDGIAVVVRASGSSPLVVRIVRLSDFGGRAGRGLRIWKCQDPAQVGALDELGDVGLKSFAQLPRMAINGVGASARSVRRIPTRASQWPVAGDERYLKTVIKNIWLDSAQLERQLA
jgi:hypothetical protein